MQKESEFEFTRGGLKRKSNIDSNTQLFLYSLGSNIQNGAVMNFWRG